MIGQDVADVGRMLAVVVAAVVAGVSLRVAVDRKYRSRSQLFRFLGLAVLTGSVSTGEYHALGRPPTWWILIPLWVGLGLSLAGTLPLATSRKRSESLRPVDPPEGG